MYNQSGVLVAWPHNCNTANRDYSGAHLTTMVQVPAFSYASVAGWSGGVPTATVTEEAYRLNGSASGGVNASATITDVTWDARY